MNTPRTYFAPPERANAAAIAADNEILTEVPFVQEILDSFPDAAMVLNSDRQIVMANAGLAAMLKLDATELLGNRPGEVLSCVHAGEVAGGCGTSKSCASCGAGRAIVDSYGTGNAHVGECTITRSNAQGDAALPLRVWATPMSSDRRFTVLAVRDTTDEKRRLLLERVTADLAHQVRHDDLTGLPNRLLFSEVLGASIEQSALRGQMTAVVYLDLDGFKVINATLGHVAGDALLRQTSERLRECIQEPDTLARMGGDEFTLVINDVGDERVAVDIAERALAALREPFFVDDHELYLTASVGIAIYPCHGKDASTLRGNADAAMYEAKSHGKDCVLVFTSKLRHLLQERLELDTYLRRAMEIDQLSLVYQPIFDAHSGRQAAFEALLRWNHPELGMISPSRFIPIAEECGLIVPLGAWVLKEACRQCREWQENGFAGVRVAVNVSAQQFALPEFTDSVLHVLDQAGLSGELLDLELTERTIMPDIESSLGRMTRLQERGIRISIDDFGTGYSSLGYLPRLPLDMLKIDQSFVAKLGTDESAEALIRGIISLAHSIRKRVIVEGVETREQLEILRGIGADEIQGFLLGRPASLEHWSVSHATALFEQHGRDQHRPASQPGVVMESVGRLVQVDQTLSAMRDRTGPVAWPQC